jgi:hypothetical protein
LADNVIQIQVEFEDGTKGFAAIPAKAQKAGQEAGNVFSDSLGNSIREFTQDVLEAGAGLRVLGLTAKNLTPDIRDLGTQLSKTLFVPKGLVSLISSLGVASVTLLSFGQIAKRSENSIIRLAGAIAQLSGIALGGIAAALTAGTLIVANFAFEVGNNLVGAFKKISDSFARANSDLVILNSTIEAFNRVTDGAIGSTQTYSNLISELSDELNLSVGSLSRATQEIVSVGARLGLTGDEIQKLIRITAEYSKINRKDVFNTSVAIVNALQGQAQSVQALGIKLSAASNQQFLYKKGLDQSFDALSEQSKVQVRYNNLLTQFGQVAGIAQAAAGTLADQDNRFAVQQERLNTALGKGASIIENNNIATFLYNKVLSNINDNLLAAAGFFGALGSRILQITGFVVGLSVKIFLLIKGIKLLNVLLSSNVAETVFGKALPVLGRSIDQLTMDISKSSIRIRSLKDVFAVLATTIRAQSVVIVSSLTGIEAASLTVRGALLGTMRVAIGALKRGAVAAAAFLAPFLPLIGVISAFVVGLSLVVKSIKELESRTKAFSEIFNILIQAVKETSTVFEPFIKQLKGFGDFLKNSLSVAIGGTVALINKMLLIFLSIAKQDPFGVLSEKSIQRLSALQGRLQSFQDQLVAANFNIGDLAGRSIASTAANAEKLVTVTIEQVNRLTRELANAGLSQSEILKRQLDERNSILTQALEAGLINQARFQDLSEKALLDYNTKLAQLNNGVKGFAFTVGESLFTVGSTISGFVTFVGSTFSNFSAALTEQIEFTKDQMQELANAVGRTFASSVTSGISKMVQAMRSGKTALEAFGGALLGIVGDLAISIGQYTVAVGVAKLALESLPGGATIAAGIGLIAVGTLLKTLGGDGGALGTGAAGGAPGADLNQPPPDFAQNEDIEERKPVTEVAVNIQGNVLDRRETGLEIAEVLNEFFDAQDGTVVANS